MAKRTVSKLAVGGDHSGNSTVPDASICSSTVDDEDASQDRPATALALCEETTSTEAAAEGALSAPLSWPFLCPLCSAVELVDPVDLHERPKDTLSPSSFHSKTVDEAVHCLACRACVEQWLSAVRAFSEGQAETMDHTGGATSATTFSPLSASACDGATLLACPLCNRTCDATILSHSGPIAGVAHALDASVVRNSYTGSQPLSCITKTGSGVGRPSAPAASASPFCSICEEAKAMCVCLQCDFGMCDTCHRATHAKGGFRQHEVLSCEQARRRGNQRCTQHAGMALDLFCDTCSTCVCVTCCFGGAHRGHEVFPLADVASRAAAALTQHSTELAALQRDADATSVQLASLWPAYEAKVDDVRTEIQQCFSSLRQVLQAREDALLSRLGEVSAVVSRRSSALRSAMHAISSFLGSTGERLRRLPGSVSPATLMRILDTVHEQQQWVSRVSTRVIEQATAVAEGWSYHMCSDSANGCRMASFVLLNSDTPNDDGLRQYKRVLADLGRLDASADVQLPLAVQGSAGSVGTAKGRDNREEESAAHHLWGGMAEDHTEPRDGLANGAPVALRGDSDAIFDAGANVGEGEETLLVRPSHIDPATPSLPGQTAASKCREVSMAYRGRDRGGSRQRSMSASTVQSQPRQPHLFPIGASTQSTRGRLLTYELNVDPTLKGAGAVAGPAAEATTASGTPRLTGVASKWGAVKQDLWEVGGCGSFAAELGALGRQKTGCAAATRDVRDTIPFRVSLPPQRVESHDRMDDDDRSVSEADDQLPWRALKLHHNSSVQDGVRSTATSVPRHGSTARLHYLTELDLRKPSEVAHGALDSSLAAPKQGRAESQRRTTGLQLEL
ncbi:conserved hypothetical protein [Leishmania major strain Friedlin]|uniref:B box-type domain-containing protein n=1 Tax=Leishmania major TaxID=5664 RepID=Q4Q1S1_LEIMA|nr:conserved hypothetical protein [Leishmania major strain Friedlin]CAG9583675.1 predicted_tripartite_motif_protein [Leishmania major strain Friedlin]CAJ09108.1 conserved hypothetical protein [Leishmania major strain Friedlin]|eukprot:XP_001686727.1 conserved hypothetical protein [Leishmania major strain Friedlin]